MPIKFSQISDPTWNSRLFVDPKKIEALAESIKARGLQQPVRLALVSGELNSDEAKYELVAGSRRLAACKLIGMTEFGDEDTVVVEYGGDEAGSDKVIDNIVENMQREDLSTYEQARALSTLRGAGLSLEQVKTQTGVAKSQISTLVKAFETLPDEIKQEWAQRNPVLTINFMSSLGALKDPDKQLQKFKEQNAFMKSLKDNESNGDEPSDNDDKKPPKKNKRTFSVSVERYQTLEKCLKKGRAPKLTFDVMKYLVGEVEFIDQFIAEPEEKKTTKGKDK